MPELEKNIQERIDKLIDEGDKVYNQGNIKGAINYLKEAWEIFPDSKFCYPESYHVANYITLLSMEVKDFETAKEWALVTQKCHPERGDIVEKEFLIGQVAFESGDLKEAYKYFKLADEISKGLCFQGEDSKYVNLLYNKPE